MTQLADGRIEVAPHLAERTGCPVEIAQRVEHGALHAPAGERIERHAGRRLVTRGGVDQSEYADAHKVVHLDLRRQALRQALCQRLHEAHMLQHERVAVGPLLDASP
jgi:hypothetical protein